MGKKITQYTNNVSSNPDTGSLFDLSEKTGTSTYESRKWSLSTFKTWVATYCSIAWANITGKPTTLSGYGITDAIDGSGAVDRIAFYSDSNTITSSDNLIVEHDYGASNNDVIIVNNNKSDVTSAYRNKTIIGSTSGFSQVSNSYSQSNITTYNNAGYVSPIFSLVKQRGTIDVPADYQSGDTLSILRFGGSVDSITSIATENQSSGYGNYLVFKTGITGTTSEQEVIRLQANGKIRIGNAYDFPKVDGSNGQFQKTDGAGNLSWATLTTSDISTTVQSVTSSATVTATSTNDLVKITAQAEALTLANPSGTFSEGQPLMIRIKDNGTARSISYGAKFRAIGVTLPTTTVINKTVYLGVIYNSTDDKFDVLGVNQEA